MVSQLFLALNSLQRADVLPRTCPVTHADWLSCFQTYWSFFTFFKVHETWLFNVVLSCCTRFLEHWYAGTGPPRGARVPGAGARITGIAIVCPRKTTSYSRCNPAWLIYWRQSWTEKPRMTDWQMSTGLAVIFSFCVQLSFRRHELSRTIFLHKIIYFINVYMKIKINTQTSRKLFQNILRFTKLEQAFSRRQKVGKWNIVFVRKRIWPKTRLRWPCFWLLHNGNEFWSMSVSIILQSFYFFYPVRCILFDFFSCFLLTCIFVLVLGMSIGNESAPIQLAQCWFPGLAISNAKI